VVIVETKDGSVIKTEIEAEVTNADAKEVKITSASIPKSEGLATAVAIPATYEIDGVTYNVTSIADNAFAGKTEIMDIYLPVTDKAIEIGENALKIDGENNWLEPVIESKNYSAADYYVLKDGEFHVIIANDSKVPACKAVLRKSAGVGVAKVTVASAIDPSVSAVLTVTVVGSAEALGINDEAVDQSKADTRG